jgi:hypothetical protein
VYVPQYATRYGVIGAVFAMISARFCVRVVMMSAAAAGREARDHGRGALALGDPPVAPEGSLSRSSTRALCSWPWSS